MPFLLHRVTSFFRSAYARGFKNLDSTLMVGSQPEYKRHIATKIMI